MLIIAFYVGMLFGLALTAFLRTAHDDHELTPHDVEVLRHAASFWPEDSAGAREITRVADKLAARLPAVVARADG